jgi:hypothetical protein
MSLRRSWATPTSSRTTAGVASWLVTESDTVFMDGQFPPHFPEKLCIRKAFIYFLEIWAQILPMIVWWRELDD